MNNAITEIKTLGREKEERKGRNGQGAGTQNGGNKLSRVNKETKNKKKLGMKPRDLWDNDGTQTLELYNPVRR